MSKDETKKKSIIQKDLKKLRLKKKLIRGYIKIFSWMVKLNWKIALTKEKQIKRTRVKLKKVKQKNNWLKDDIEIKNPTKRLRKKIKILKIRTKMKNKIFEKL
jgi:hypothetical protein